MQPMMDRTTNRAVEDLAGQYVAGTLSRRGFVTRMLALGLGVGTAGTVLAACAPKQNTSPPPPKGGQLRFLIGPWTDQETEHQQVIADAFKKTHPGVELTFKLYDWDTGSTTTNTSLAQNAHDIYYFGEGDYLARVQQKDGFADLAGRINASDFAQDKAKYLYWDRVEALGSRVMGLQVCSHFEDALFVNMDMVKSAGFDESFVNSWDTFAECLKKMTNGNKTYGLGIGMQLGGFGEWYQRARAAGGRFLTEDLKAPAINTPDVVAATQQLVDLFDAGVAPKPGTFDYNTAPDAFIAGRMACYSSDLTIAAVIKAKDKQPSFEWKILPYPPGSKQKAMFADLGFYGMSSKIPDPDLGWDALTWWTGGQYAAYWASVSGTYPARSDALANGYDKQSAPQLAEAFDTLQSMGVGPEPFAAWGTIEGKAEKQVARAYTGEISAQVAVANVEKIVRDEALK